eukprot:TRINITY_DN5463_c0_g1_i1.p1 TRINITY_DN5463_c0_g1~~TRINITY_DN5463_c0_g1_i1.p1  ORF type:complete len:2866 (-),score=1037.09 TRINITY_DN5463_c0_g1_i1:28-7458(-)
MGDILDEIAAATAQPSLYQNAEMLKKIADKVPGAAGASRDDLLKSARDVAGDLQRQAAFEAQETNNPKKRDAIHQGLAELSAALADLNKESRAGNTPGAQQAAAKVKSAVDKIIEKTQAKPDDAIERLIQESRTVRNDAVRGDVDSLRVSVPELQKTGQDVVVVAKEAAAGITDEDEQDRKNNLLHLAELIPDAVKEEATAAAALVSQPTNVAAKRRADDAAKNLEDIANQLRNALKSRDSTPQGDSLVRGPAEAAKKAAREVAETALQNPRDLGQKGHQLKDAIGHLKDKSQQAAVESPDSKKARDIQDSIKSLDESFTDLINAAAKAAKAPEDVRAQAELETAKKNLEDQIEAVAVAVGTPSLAENLDKLSKLASELSEEKKKGNNKAVEDKLRQMANLEKAIRDQVNHNKKANQSPEQVANIERAQKRLDEAIEAARNDVHSGKDWAVVNRDCEDIKRAAQALKDATNAAPLAAIANLRKIAQNVKDDAVKASPNWQPTGKKLQGDSKELANQVREATKHIEDPAQKQKALKAASELEDAANKEYFAAHSVVAYPDNQKSKQALVDGHNQVAKVLKDLEESLLNKHNPNDDLVAKRHPGEISDSPFKHKVDAAKRQIQEIVGAAENENPAAIAPAANALKEILEELTKDANGIISDPDRDEKVRQDVMDAARAFNETFTPIIAHAQAVLKNPQDVNAKQGLQSAGDNLANVLDDFEKASQQPTLYKNLEQMKNVLDKVAQDKQRGNQKALEDDLEDLEELHARVKEQGDYLAAVNKDPRQRQQLRNNLADLDAIIASIRDNVKNINSSPKDMHDDVVYGRNKIDDIIKGSQAAPLAAVGDVSRANQASVHAAQRNNPQSVKAAADKVSERARNLINQVRGAAKDPNADPEKQRKLNRVADDLERALGKYQEVAEKAATNPTAYKAELKDAAEGLEAALEDASKALKNAQSVGNPNDSELKEQIDEVKRSINAIPGGSKSPQDLQREIAAVNKKLDDLDNAARVVAANKDPVNRKAIQDAVGGSKNAIPALQAAIAKHIQDPSNKKYKDEVEVASDNVKDHLDNLEEKTRPPTLAEGSAALKKALDEIVQGHGKRSPQENEKALRDLAEKAEVFLARAKDQAGKNMDRNERDALLAEVNAVANTLAAVDDAVRRNLPVNAVQAQAENSKKAIDSLLAKMHAKALQDAQDVAREAAALKRAANAGDAPLVNEKANALRAAIEKLKQSAGKSAQDLPSDQSKRVLDALSRLPQAGETEVVASVGVVRNPNDVAARSQLRSAEGDVKDIVDAIMNGLINAPGGIGGGEVYYGDEEVSSSSSSSSEEEVVVGFDPTLNVAPPDSSSPLSKDVERLRQIVKDVKDSADKRDAMGVAVHAKKEQKEAGDLAEKVKEMINNSPSERQRKDLADALNQMEKAIPYQLFAAKKALENPQDAAAKQELAEATQRVQDALSRLDAASRQPDLSVNAEKIKAAARDVAGGAKTGDKQAVNEALKKANDLGNKMKQQADYIASQNIDPAARKKIADQGVQLKKAIGDLEVAARQGKTDLQKEVDNVTRAADALAAATHADPLSALQRVLDRTDDLERAGERGDANGLIDSAPELNSAADVLIKSVELALYANPLEPIQHRKIEEAKDEVNHAVKAALVASKELIDRPNDPQAKAKLKAATGDLRDVLGSLESALQNKEPAPKEKQDLDRNLAALEAVLPKLEKDKKNLAENPRDPRLKAKVVKTSAKVGEKAKDVAAGIAPSQQDQSELENKGARGRVRDMVKAINENNHPAFKRHYNALEKDLPKYKAQAIKACAGSPERLKEVEEALQDIDKLMPKVAHAAREVEADPHNPAKRRDFQVAAQKLDRAFARANNKANPPKDEREVRDAAANLRAKLAAIRAARKNNPEQVPEQIEDWQKVRNNLRRVGDKRGFNPEASGPSKELEEKWNKFGVRNKQAAVSPKPSDDAEIAALESEVENALGKFVQATNANKIAAVLDAESKLDDVLAAVEAQQPQRGMANLQQLSGVVGNLQRELNPTAAAGEASAFIEPVKDVIRKANDALQNPGDEVKEKEVKEAIERAKVHLANSNLLLDPKSVDRNPRAELQKAKAAIADLTAACRTNNPTAVRNALEKAKAQVQTAAAVTKNITQNQPDNQNIRAVQEAVSGLEDTLKNYNQVADSNTDLVELVSRQVDNAVDDVVDALDGAVHDKLVAATANVLKDSDTLAKSGKEMAPKEVSKTADDIVKNTQDILGKGKKQSEELGKNSGKPITQAPRYAPTRPEVVDKIVQSRPQRAQPPPTSVLVADLTAIATPKPKPVVVPPPVVKPAPKKDGSLEDVVEQVADDITAKGNQYDNVQARDIGYHLTQLAKYARSGQRQSMLEEARAASLKIAELCKILRAKAAAVPGKNIQEKMIQDRLIRAAQALQNYGMQLKILTSVKAASVTTDKDTDESLASIVKGIGNVVDEGLTSMDITDRTILKTKK